MAAANPRAAGGGNGRPSDWPVCVATGGLAALLGGLGLAGWYLRLPQLVRFGAGSVSIPRNAALGFLLAGLSLVGVGLGRRRARLLAAASLALGAVALVEDALRRDAVIDWLLLPTRELAGGVVNRPIPANGALALVLVGVGILSLRADRPRTTLVITACGSLSGALGSVAALGYVLDITPAYEWGAYARISPQGAVCCWLLGVGIIAAAGRTTDGWPLWLVPPVAIGGVSGSFLLWWSFVAFSRRRGAAIPLTEATTAVLVIGVAMSAMAAVSVALAQRARQRTRELVAANRALEQEVARRERDMAQRERAQLEADRRAVQLDKILESIGDGVIVTDRNGRLVLANATAARILRRPVADLRGLPPGDLMLFEPGTDTPFPIEQIPRVRALRGETTDAVLVAYQLAGTTDRLYLSMTARPLPPEDDGTIPGAVVGFRDVTERHRLSAALAASEQRHRTLVHNFPNGAVFMYDHDLRYLVADGEILPEIGFTSEQMVGRTIWDLYSPEYCEQVGPAYRAALRGETTRSDRTLAGHVFDVRTHPIRDDGGQVVAGLAIAHDVTAQRRAKAAQLEAETRLGTIIRDFPNGAVALFDRDLRFLLAGGEALARVGMSPDRLVGKTLWEVFPAEYCELLAPAYRAALRGETVHDDRTYEGRTFEVRTQPIRDEDGRVVAGSVISQDVTARRAAEAQLRASEARLRAIIRNFPNGGIFLYDHHLRYLVAGGEALGEVGMASEDLVGRTIFEVFPPEYSAQMAPAYRAALRGEIVRDDRTFRGRTFDVRTRPIHEGGQVVAGLAISHDVTAQRKAEAVMREAEAVTREANEQLERRVAERTAELAASNAELEAFSYSVSHDLRAPLRALTGFSHILLDEHGDRMDADAREYATLIGQSAAHMGRLIDSLLAFSRMQRQPLQLEHVDLQELTRHAWQQLAPERAGRDVGLRLGDLPAARGDPALVRQVVENLLANALKYTATREAATIEVAAATVDGEVVYRVADNGVGFDMRYADKLFKPFQRLHDNAEFPGTGIGLALVARIVARHGGRIWADAAPDRGATFYFTLQGHGSDDDPARGGRPQRRSPDPARA